MLYSSIFFCSDTFLKYSPPQIAIIHTTNATTPIIANIFLLFLLTFIPGTSTFWDAVFSTGQPQYGHKSLSSGIILPHSIHMFSFVSSTNIFPQCIHFFALSEISCPHSGHLIIAILLYLSFFTRLVKYLFILYSFLRRYSSQRIHITLIS